LPNTILVFNGEDVPICHRLHGCKSPVFSLFKRKNAHERQRKIQEERGETEPRSQSIEAFPDREILIPNFSQRWDSLRFFPWEGKRNVAMLRASLQVRWARDG
jgi:hypothetical protein